MTHETLANIVNGLLLLGAVVVFATAAVIIGKKDNHDH